MIPIASELCIFQLPVLAPLELVLIGEGEQDTSPQNMPLWHIDCLSSSADTENLVKVILL